MPDPCISLNEKILYTVRDDLIEETWISYIVSLFGIKRQNHSSTITMYLKSMYSFTSILVHVSFFYSAAALSLYSESFSTKRTLADIGCISFSIVIWHQVQLQKAKICQFYSYLRSLPRNLVQCNRKERGIINGLVFMAFILPVAFSAAMLSAALDGSSHYANFWLFSHSIRYNKAVQALVVFFCMVIFFSTKFLILSLVAITYGAFSYKLSKAIRLQNDVLKKSIHSEIFPAEIKLYYRIIQCCKLFNSCSKGTMLLIIFMYCIILYTGLALALFQSIVIPTTSMVAEYVLTITVCISSVVALLTFSSEIPAAMMETKTKFRNIYQFAVLDPETTFTKRVLQWKSLAEIEPFYLTAWDMFPVEKGVILSLFGTSLSFIILIMQLKRIE
ncbi:uncharacterized protein CDAR_17171 [Caerostris darwini]|uniref:Gustatory receptor n=1 Tax=Caerostris darwini TaxID=1538125 RepID=A0AAV4N514_9ARAC|nr:uncharacterized protein CDAR_17171 [Caerostris darwini]